MKLLTHQGSRRKLGGPSSSSKSSVPSPDKVALPPHPSSSNAPYPPPVRSSSSSAPYRRFASSSVPPPVHGRISGARSDFEQGEGEIELEIAEACFIMLKRACSVCAHGSPSFSVEYSGPDKKLDPYSSSSSAPYRRFASSSVPPPVHGRISGARSDFEQGEGEIELEIAEACFIMLKRACSVCAHGSPSFSVEYSGPDKKLDPYSSSSKPPVRSPLVNKTRGLLDLIISDEIADGSTSDATAISSGSYTSAPSESSVGKPPTKLVRLSSRAIARKFISDVLSISAQWMVMCIVPVDGTISSALDAVPDADCPQSLLRACACAVDTIETILCNPQDMVAKNQLTCLFDLDLLPRRFIHQLSILPLLLKSDIVKEARISTSRSLLENALTNAKKSKSKNNDKPSRDDPSSVTSDESKKVTTTTSAPSDEAEKNEEDKDKEEGDEHSSVISSSISPSSTFASLLFFVSVSSVSSLTSLIASGRIAVRPTEAVRLLSVLQHKITSIGEFPLGDGIYDPSVVSTPREIMSSSDNKGTMSVAGLGTPDSDKRELVARSLENESIVRGLLMCIRGASRTKESAEDLWEEGVFDVCLSVCEKAVRREAKKRELGLSSSSVKLDKDKESSVDGDSDDSGESRVFDVCLSVCEKAVRREAKKRELGLSSSSVKLDKDKESSVDGDSDDSGESSPSHDRALLKSDSKDKKQKSKIQILAKIASDIMCICVDVLHPLRGIHKISPKPNNPFSVRLCASNDAEEQIMGDFVEDVLCERYCILASECLRLRSMWSNGIINILSYLLPFDICAEKRRVERAKKAFDELKQSLKSNEPIDKSRNPSDIESDNARLHRAEIRCESIIQRIVNSSLHRSSCSLLSILFTSHNRLQEQEKPVSSSFAPNPQDPFLSVVSLFFPRLGGFSCIFVCVKILRLVCEADKDERDPIARSVGSILLGFLKLCSQDLQGKKVGVWDIPNSYISCDILQTISYLFSAKSMPQAMLSLPLPMYNFSLSTNVSEEGEEESCFETPESKALHAQTAFIRLSYSLINSSNNVYISQFTKDETSIRYLSRVLAYGLPKRLFKGACKILFLLFSSETSEALKDGLDRYIARSGNEEAFSMLCKAMLVRIKKLTQSLVENATLSSTDREGFDCVMKILDSSNAIRETFAKRKESVPGLIALLEACTHPSVNPSYLLTVSRIVRHFSRVRSDAAQCVMKLLRRQLQSVGDDAVIVRHFSRVRSDAAQCVMKLLRRQLQSVGDDAVFAKSVHVFLEAILTDEREVLEPLFCEDTQDIALIIGKIASAKVDLPSLSDDQKKEKASIKSNLQSTLLQILASIIQCKNAFLSTLCSAHLEMPSVLMKLIVDICVFSAEKRMIDRNSLILLNECMLTDQMFPLMRSDPQLLPALIALIGAMLHAQKGGRSDISSIHTQVIALSQGIFTFCLTLLTDTKAAPDRYKYRVPEKTCIEHINLLKPAVLDPILITCLKIDTTTGDKLLPLSECAFSLCEMMVLASNSARTLCNCEEICNEIFTISKQKKPVHKDKKRANLLLNRLSADGERKQILKRILKKK
ncbi:hypothetical protein ADUPG1_006935 [Aduncisulcus paluster]|uniref:ARM repeat superfamily protein n=1 Tax=Aduncisulcus paluster TaxID=2918883 RepID=A0ABQ5KK56_9EUKA|nr:hypothetical protein ADUPG1_006935 [Aduncisulcus paluster]